MPSVFERNPKKTIFVVIIAMMITMDFSLSIIYTRIKENKERVGLGIPHKIYHHDFIKNGYRAMDTTAVSLCMENNLPISVFNLYTKDNMKNIVLGKDIGTIIDCGGQKWIRRK